MFSGLCYRTTEESKDNETEMSVAQGFHVHDEENSNTKKNGWNKGQSNYIGAY
jgi:hypothetical protein